MPASQTAATERRNERMVSIYIYIYILSTVVVSAGSRPTLGTLKGVRDECLGK